MISMHNIKQTLNAKLSALFFTLLALLPMNKQAKYLSLYNDKRGSVAMVIALIVTVAVLVIGVYIMVTFQEGMPSITDPIANRTATNIFEAAWNAYGLAVVIPIIIVAGAIIGYLVRGFSGGTR